MKIKSTGLSQRYVTALRKYLKTGPGTSLQPALRLGREAVVLGLDTLELARIHEAAVLSLELSKSKNSQIDQARMFFTEAMVPIVETPRSAQQGRIQLNQLKESLSQRMAELSSTNRQLQRVITRRKSVEAALKKSGERYDKLLKDSQKLHNGLRQLTHRVLEGQEDQRKAISHELQDEIAQTLVGINVRLLTLKREVQNNTKGLKNEIANTQRLVVKSAKSVRQVERKFRCP